MIDVPENTLAIVQSILKKHVPQCEVRVFGSRLLGTAKPYSDLDLVLVGSARLSSKTLAGLREDFEESDIPFRVDLLDWHSLSPEFKAVIETHYEIMQPAA